MKKTLPILVLVILLATVFVGMASANNGPHGGYTATTDACAGCHRAHTAAGGNLLISADTQALCVSCHGAAATGADTDVMTGVYTDDDGVTEAPAEGTGAAALIGGGFTGATSAHDISGTATDPWGADAATGRGAVTAGFLASGLDCGSCHDPHGAANYRLLRYGTVTDHDPDIGDAGGAGVVDKNYTTEQWSDASISDFCAGCHTAYHETAANVGNDELALTIGGNGTYTFTHRIDMVWNLATSTNVTTGSFGPNNPETAGYDGTGASGDEIPLAGIGNDTSTCTTCHFAHGTTATMTTGGPAESAGPAASSALLRLDNRGVCQACHQK